MALSELLLPWAQHVIVSCIEVCLLVATCVAALIERNRPRGDANVHHHNRRDDGSHSSIDDVASLIRYGNSKSSFHVKLAIAATSLLSICHFVLALRRIVLSIQRSIAFHETLFSVCQALSWIAMLAILLHESEQKGKKHLPILRAWWLVYFFLSAGLCAAGIVFIVDSNYSAQNDFQLWLDSILNIATMPIALFLFMAAVMGTTGIKITINTSPELEEPLFPHENPPASNELITGFHTAGFFSKVSFAWVNPLLTHGMENPLSTRDVPQLAPNDKADKTYAKLMECYNTQEEPKSLKRALLRSFWRELLFTASLAFIKVFAVYVGPLLIIPFENYVSGDAAFALEGLALVATLLIAKCIEVTSSHHYNFNSNKLGMVIRSALITTVYRKGLLLSSLGRQSHGTGQIVNYMSVDVQQVSDSMLQLHNIWTVPLNALIALCVLFNVIGASCLAGLAVMLIILFISFNLARIQRIFQGKIMFYKDRRMALTTEVLNSMKVIKLQAWEDTFRNKIEEVRGPEQHWLAKFVYLISLNVFILWVLPTSVSTVTFTVCLLLTNRELTSGTVFTTISTFRILQEPLRLFPQSLMSVSQALNSLDRIEKFLRSDELDQVAVERVAFDSETSVAIDIDQGVFTWEKETEKPTLVDIKARVFRGNLVCIIGQVGAGKSTLLAAMLGEIPKLSGTVKVIGSTAFVAQLSWIQNATIENNIRFGKPMDRERYEETLTVCSLTQDLAQMEFGDQTEIGERGINLSGGQKQRIQLARAVYQDCDIYLLDDVFSAVDAETGSALFQECVNGVLSKKTVVLVTHQVDFLHGADQIWVMRDGQIIQSGNYDELLEAGLDFKDIVKAHDAAMQLVKVDEVQADNEQVLMDVQESSQSPLTFSNERYLERQMSESQGSPKRLLRKSSSGLNAARITANKNAKMLIEDEERETGQVGWRVYFLYCTKTYRGMHVLAILVFQACWQVLQVSSDYYLSDATTVGLEEIGYGIFLGVYSGLAFGSSAFVLLRAVTVAHTGLKNSQSFFLTFLRAIMRAPMSFFDTTPSGRILSRFGIDQSNIDVLIPLFMGITVAMIFATIGVLFVIVQITWYMFFIIIPLAWVYIRYQQYYFATSRELTRIDNITKAPVIHHFSETVAGMLTVRAFREQERFKRENLDRVNDNLRMDFHNNAANEWLGFRLELIGTVVLCTSTLFMVTIGKDTMPSTLVGLSLSYSLALNSILYGLVFITCQLENKMVSVERINQYSNIPSEAPAVIENRRPPSGWPSSGTILFRNFQLRYRPETPLVLKGISMKISGGQKVGVVGRTGSGKSTLILALFRVVEGAGGHVDVDGINIADIGLKDLRSKLGIIPQDPTLFEGTVRTNMDPQRVHDDAHIWQSLDKCHLGDSIRGKEGRLDCPVMDSGENWSMGQRQLFCLGRALLNRSKILMLDEATASVDSQTDAIMQRTIRNEFAHATVISIAHRIATVMDSDKVLVLDAGYVREFDTPAALLEDPSSMFAALVRESRARCKSIPNLQNES